MAYAKALGVLIVLGAIIGSVVAVVENLLFEGASINSSLVAGVIIGVVVASLLGPLERRFKGRDRDSTSSDGVGGS